MNSAALNQEKRLSKRYRVTDKAFALLKQPQYKELGKIVDISETGISFLCINQGDWTEAPFKLVTGVQTCALPI